MSVRSSTTTPSNARFRRATAAARCCDFEGEAGNRGFFQMDVERLRRIITRAHRAGWQVATHAIGDRAVATVLDIYQDALAADVFGSPVYVLDGEVFWGQDRIELMADALRSGRKPYHSQVQHR